MQLNINGCSQQTKLALDKYMNETEADLVFLQETKTSEIQENDFKNYQIYLKPNKVNPKRQGGVAVLVHSSIISNRTLELESEDTDLLFFTAALGKKRILFASAYTKPNGIEDLKKVMQQLEYASQNIQNFECTELMMLGDLNARHPLWNDYKTNDHGKWVLQKCNESNLTVSDIINENTFLCTNGGSIIDITVHTAGVTTLIESQYVDEEPELFSGAPARGHIPVWTIMTISHDHQKVRESSAWSKGNWTQFTEVLETKSAKLLPEIARLKDPLLIWGKIRDNLIQTKKETIPTVKISNHSKPYWTAKLSDLSRALREAKKKFKQRSTFFNGDLLDQAKETFKSALEEAKNLYLQEKANELNQINGDDFWKKFKRTFYSSKNFAIGDIKSKDTIYTTNEQKSQLFYEDIFLGKHMPTDSHSDKQETQYANRIKAIKESRGNSSVGISKDVTAEEITSALRALKTTGKSPDYDGIHPMMLKASGVQFHINLMVLFNAILDKSKWPFTNNVVTLLRKPGKKDYTNTGSYRPITITSICGKVLERILESRLRHQAEQENWIPHYQHGFRKGRSTTTYLCNMVAEIQHNVSAKNKVAGIFIDLQKAFDSVWHDGMLIRLADLGVEGQFIKLISDFLSNRMIRIKVNGHISEPLQCKIGLPQGSLLSPLLFMLYTRDMLEGIDGTSYQYADDCSVICSKPDDNTLNDTLERNCKTFSDWIHKWRMKANCSKTDVMWFRGHPTPLTISNEDINTAHSTKVLGITIDDNLTFQIHREESKGIIARKWNMLKPFIFTGLKPIATRKILNTVIIPKAYYNSFIWDENHTLSVHYCMKDLLGTSLNPPTEALHQISRIPTGRDLASRDIYNYCRMAAGSLMLATMLEYTRSKLQKRVQSHIVKIKGRNFSDNPLTSEDFRKSIIHRKLREDRQQRWKTSLEIGNCGTGLLVDLRTDHLEKHPFPLDIPRKETSILTGVLTGHINLQCHLYRIGITFSPTCICLQEDETVQHYLYNCSLYTHLRTAHPPDINDYGSILKYCRSSGRW